MKILQVLVIILFVNANQASNYSICRVAVWCQHVINTAFWVAVNLLLVGTLVSHVSHPYFCQSFIGSVFSTLQSKNRRKTFFSVKLRISRLQLCLELKRLRIQLIDINQTWCPMPFVMWHCSVQTGCCCRCVRAPGESFEVVEIINDKWYQQWDSLWMKSSTYASEHCAARHVCITSHNITLHHALTWTS